MKIRRRLVPVFLATALFLGVCPSARAYAVIAHEAIVDAAWEVDILPVLKKHFPESTPEQLQQALAYAYGGAIIQDMGYYPFGSKVFSDLAHYVRSGEFVLNLLSDARNLDDLAFALGALSHYVADSNGHPQSTNRVVPLMYPRLEKKYGDVVTYEDAPLDHMKVEFSFDVVQVAQGDYAPNSYHDHIGFSVAKEALERAFAKTYSLDLSDVFFDDDLTIETYRFSVAHVIPTMTKVAWSLKKDDIRRARPGMTRKKFLYNLSKAEYRRTWGTHHRHPGVGARFLAFLIRILPKVGPLRALEFPEPPRRAETLFMRSFNDTLSQYRRLVAAYDRGDLKLPNDNFDTGGPVEPGTYRLMDETYAKLLDLVSDKSISPELRANILAYYANPNAPNATRKKRKEWKKVQAELSALRAETAAAPAR